MAQVNQGGGKEGATERKWEGGLQRREIPLHKNNTVYLSISYRGRIRDINGTNGDHPAGFESFPRFFSFKIFEKIIIEKGEEEKVIMFTLKVEFFFLPC